MTPSSPRKKASLIGGRDEAKHREMIARARLQSFIERQEFANVNERNRAYNKRAATANIFGNGTHEGKLVTRREESYGGMESTVDIQSESL